MTRMTEATRLVTDDSQCRKPLAGRRWICGVLIVAAIAAAYSNSFGGPFIFDDIKSIPDNTTIRRLWPLGPVLWPPSEGGRTVAGRPLINLSLAVNYAISGRKVWSYHALNLLVHILAALTLWGVVRRTLLLPAMPTHLRKAADWLATAAALFWGLHPLTTAAVTYIVQRAESITGLFYLLTLYCVIRGWCSRRPSLWSAAAVAAAALGMVSKEVMATAPLVVLLYDRTLLSGSFRQAVRRRWGLYAGLAATWVILGLLVARSPRAGTAGFGIALVTPWEYARSQFGVVLYYLRLCFWPHPLCLDYGWPVASQFGQVFLPAVIIVAMLTAVIIAVWRSSRMGFLGASFFLILAPTSSVVPIWDLAFEHRMYLPLAAVVIVVVLMAHRVLHEGAGRGLPWASWRRWVGGVSAMLVAAVLGCTTFQRNNDYRSGISIWEDTTRKSPNNPRASYNLGRHMVEEGQYSLALGQFLRTVQLQPDYSNGYMSVGCALANIGRHEEALGEYAQAIRVAPKYADNYFNRAISYCELSRFEEAIDDCNAAIALDPKHAQAYYRRGLAQQKLKRTQEAVASYSEAIRLKPDYDDPFGERAISYYILKRYDDAWADLRVFRKLGGTPNPKFVEVLSRASGRAE